MLKHNPQFLMIFEPTPYLSKGQVWPLEETVDEQGFLEPKNFSWAQWWKVKNHSGL